MYKHNHYIQSKRARPHEFPISNIVDVDYLPKLATDAGDMKTESNENYDARQVEMDFESFTKEEVRQFEYLTKAESKIYAQKLQRTSISRGSVSDNFTEAWDNTTQNIDENDAEILKLRLSNNQKEKELIMEKMKANKLRQEIRRIRKTIRILQYNGAGMEGCQSSDPHVDEEQL